MGTDQARGVDSAEHASPEPRDRGAVRGVLARIGRPSRRVTGVAVGALVASVAIFGGTAYAYFSASGKGTGAGSVGVLQPLVVAPGVPTTTLVPDTSTALSLLVTNPNATLTLTGITPGGGPVLVTGTPGCTGANATVSVASQPLDIVLVHGMNTITIPTGAVMGPISASACQHATFDLPVHLSVKT